MLIKSFRKELIIIGHLVITLIGIIAILYGLFLLKIKHEK
jgi:hypothetical protein